MSNVQIELDEIRAVYGTGEDTYGLIGKTVQITEGEIPFIEDGSTATVVHIDADGDVWADFGSPGWDDEQVWCLALSEYTVVA